MPIKRIKNRRIFSNTDNDKNKEEEQENSERKCGEEEGSESEKKPQKKEETSTTDASCESSKGKKKIALSKRPPYPQIQLQGDNVVEVDLKENKVKCKVCPRIEISERRYNIDTKEISMVLDFDYCGERHSVEIDRSYFEKRKLITLQKYGVGVYEFNANNVIKHLVNQEFFAKRTYTHNVIGMVQGAEGEYIFRHYEAHGKDYISTYSGDLKIKPKGTKENKMKMIQEHVLGRIPLEVILAIGLSSALVGMISGDTEIDNPIIHLSGDSTTGKSTALMFAASLYGSPNPKEKGIFSTWNATKNAILAKLRDNHGIIAVLDEASMSKVKDFSDIIYMLAAGSDKERLNKDAEIKDKKEWNTTIISSGEHSLASKSNENTGLGMRKLEFSNIEWTESAEHSDIIKTAVLGNYGYLGVDFANALIDMGKDEVIKLFRDWIDKCHDKMDKDDKFAKRLSKPMALIMTSAEIAREKLGIELNLEEILQFLIKTQSNSGRSNDIGMRAYEYFLDRYTIHSEKFIRRNIRNTQEIKPREIMGEYVIKSNQPNEILILTSVLKKMMNEGGFEDINIVLNKWRDKGILDCDANRYTRKRSIGGTSKRVNVIRVMDDFFSEEENEEAKKDEESRYDIKKIMSRKPKINKLFDSESD